MPPKKTKKRKQSLSPNSSSINVRKKVKTNPVPSAPPPQTLILPVPPSQPPLITQSEFEEIDEWAKKSYSVEIDSHQWIDPKTITFNGLINKSRFPLYEDKLLVMRKSNNFSEDIFKIIDEKTYNPHYFRGPSGVGKSYELIQTVFKIKKNFNNKYRVLHIILQDSYTHNPFDWFPKDFVYCFCNDFEDKEFPKPPTENNFIYNDSKKMGKIGIIF